jgi:hypothetical protein
LAIISGDTMADRGQKLSAAVGTSEPNPQPQELYFSCPFSSLRRTRAFWFSITGSFGAKHAQLSIDYGSSRRRRHARQGRPVS